MPRFVQKLDINGVKTRQIPCIELHGRPNAATRGAVGVLGIDVDSPAHEMYKCVAVNGAIYTWEEMSDTASLPKIVNVLSNPAGDYSADTSFEEIYKAHEAGKVVIALCDGSYYYLAGADSERVRFTACVTSADGLSVGEITISTSENGDVVEYNLVSAGGASSGTKIIPFTNMYIGTTVYCSTSVPFGEIYQAYLDGMTLVATTGNAPNFTYYYLSYISDAEVKFVRCYDNGGTVRVETITLTSSQAASFSRNAEETNPTKVVALTITSMTSAGTTYSSNTAPTEIEQAVSDGQVVVARVMSMMGIPSPDIYYLTNISTTSATFSLCRLSGDKIVLDTYTIDSDKNVTASSADAIRPTKMVTFSYSSLDGRDYYTTRTTLDEITQAHSAGQAVLACVSVTGVTTLPDIYYLTSVNTTKAIFSRSALSGERLQVATLTIDSDGNVTGSSEGAIEPTKVVTISSTYGVTGFSYTTDTTLAEINQAVSAGQVVVARFVAMGTPAPAFLYLSKVSATEVTFNDYTPSTTGSISVTTYKIDSNNLVSASSVTVYKGLPYTGPSKVTDETRITESGYYYAYVTGSGGEGGNQYYNFGVFYYTSTLAGYMVQLEEPSALLDIRDGKLTFYTIKYTVSNDGKTVNRTQSTDGNWTIYLAKLS